MSAGVGCGRVATGLSTPEGMSKHINVNPGQYKVSGREHPGEGILHDQNKERASMEEHRLREQAKQKTRTQKPSRQRKP